MLGGSGTAYGQFIRTCSASGDMAGVIADRKAIGEFRLFVVLIQDNSSSYSWTRKQFPIVLVVVRVVHSASKTIASCQRTKLDGQSNG